MNQPNALARDLPHVLPPALEMADIETRRVAHKAGEKIDMAATKKTVRLSEVPGKIWEIVLSVAKAMPYVGLLGYLYWQVDARNEESREAYVTELRTSRDMITGVVNAATQVMREVVKDSDETKKSIAEILSRLPNAPKKLGE